MDFRLLSYILIKSSSAVAVFFNVSLLYITYKSRKITTLKEFNQIININVCLDLFLVLNMTFNDIEIAISDGLFFVFSNANIWPFPTWLKSFITWNFHCCCGLSGIFGIVPLYYRYQTFVKGEPIKLYKMIPWILIPIWNTSWALMTVYQFQPRRLDYVNVLDPKVWPDAKKKFFIVSDAEGVFGNIYGASCLITFSGAFMFSGYMITRVQARMRGNSNVSGKTKKMQASFNRIVISQLLLAVLLGITPVMGVVTEMQLKLKNSNVHFVMHTFMSFLPVANSLSTLCFFKHYRRHFIMLLTCGRIDISGGSSRIDATDFSKSKIGSQVSIA
uniref:Serpentine Receptor, class T n=1 Tax=Bursaphelenchus xylophilus TaxID=6326 RepID=A0A1I7RK88_BURXY